MVRRLEAPQRYVYPVDLTEVNQDLELVCQRLRVSKAEGIRDALRHYADYVRGIKVVEVRSVGREKAEAEVLGYLRKKGRAFTSEIADDLRLDVLLVHEILTSLAERGRVK